MRLDSINMHGATVKKKPQLIDRRLQNHTFTCVCYFYVIHVLALLQVICTHPPEQCVLGLFLGGKAAGAWR